MELLDRYILAVKDALPQDKQEEIGRELKANLLDEIDAVTESRSEQALSDSSNETNYQQALEQTLLKYGHPKLTAQRFYTEPALVSGADMPLYLRVLSHSAAALFVYALLKAIVGMLQSDSVNPFRLIASTIYHFVDLAAWLFLIVTLVFYFLSKSYNLGQFFYANWSIKKLSGGPLLKIKSSDTITDIITNSFLLLILWTPLWMNEALYEQQVLSLAPSAEYWRIILTVLCIQSLLQALYRFTQSYWNKKTCIAYLGDLLLFAFAALFLAMSDPLLLLNPDIVLNDNAITRVLESISVSAQYALFTLAFILFVLAFFQYKKYKKLK